jgi:Fe-S cluster biogenesis protein NfuA
MVVTGGSPAAGIERNVEDRMDEQVASIDDDGPLDDAARAKRLADLQALIDLMRPAVQSDGGDLVLVNADVEHGVIEVELVGACSSCAISSATLQGGVERILRDRLSWVTEVIGGVDESMDDYESAALGRGAYVPRI